jgi:hypothetical protein
MPAGKLHDNIPKHLYSVLCLSLYVAWTNPNDTAQHGTSHQGVMGQIGMAGDRTGGGATPVCQHVK